MKAFILVGATGMGKSTLFRRLTECMPPERMYVNDVNGEYQHLPYCADRYRKGMALPDIDSYMNDVELVTDSVVAFEEATVFFSNRGSNAMMRKFLVGKRHTGNMYFLLFHSIRSIPYYIYDLCNYVFVFNTNDNEHVVETKHELLLDAYRAVKNKPFKFKLVKL